MARVASTGLVDAILVLDVAPDDERVALARSIRTPTVFIGVPDDHEGLVCVDLDFDAAAVLAVDRIVDAGHRSIGLLGQSRVAYEKSNFPPRVRHAFERRAGECGVAHAFQTSGERISSAEATRAAVAELLEGGATALLLHATDDVHAVVLAELAARGLSVPDDVSLVSVAASFDTTALSQAIDVIPLDPVPSCDLAVALAVRSLTPEGVTPGLHLIPPSYLDRGSVAPPADRRD
jgi:DNA-binding LacI/PurR family transcriptional regulator